MKIILRIEILVNETSLEIFRENLLEENLVDLIIRRNIFLGEKEVKTQLLPKWKKLFEDLGADVEVIE